MNRLTTPPVDALLRQAVPRLCELATDCHPTLAPILATLRQAVDRDDAAALHEALATLATRGAATGPGPRPLDTAEGRLIASILDTLALPVALEPLARDLRQALTDPAGRPRLADRLLHLLAEARAHAERRQAELQEFLKATVSRLVQLEAALGEAQRQSHQAGDEARQTRQVTELQVVQLRSAATEADDLERLKAFIEARLDHLQDHLRRQDDTEEAHQQTLEAQLSALSRQVAALSTETVNLRSRLDVTTEEALRDPLTGAYNRLAYDRRAALEVSRWRSDGGHLAMIVCDIDHFKRINDTFGHAAGDKVLKEITRVLQEQLRSADFVARYGGEEFVVLLNGATAQAALQVAEKLRRSVKATPFRSRGERVSVTLSCGVAAFEGSDTLESVFERADAALYAAKEAGRDRCVLSDAPAS